MTMFQDVKQFDIVNYVLNTYPIRSMRECLT